MTIAITIVVQLTCHTIHCVDGGVLSPVVWCQIPILSSAAEAGTVQCSDGCRQWAVAGQQGSLHCSDKVRGGAAVCSMVRCCRARSLRVLKGSIPLLALAVCPVVCCQRAGGD